MRNTYNGVGKRKRLTVAKTDPKLDRISKLDRVSVWPSRSTELLQNKINLSLQVCRNDILDNLHWPMPCDQVCIKCSGQQNCISFCSSN